MTTRGAALPGPWDVDPADEGPKPYRPVRLDTPRGPVAARHYPTTVPARAAMLWLGGTGGGWDTPAKDLYPRLAEDLAGLGVASLRVRYRDPTTLHGCVEDALTGAAFLKAQGVESLGLCGHSFGGAVAIHAATQLPEARTVVTLASQTRGAEVAATLGPRCSILLVHGTADRVLPPDCSTFLHQIAQEPKRLLLCPGAGHLLDEAAAQVHAEVRTWILERLAGSLR